MLSLKHCLFTENVHSQSTEGSEKHYAIFPHSSKSLLTSLLPRSLSPSPNGFSLAITKAPVAVCNPPGVVLPYCCLWQEIKQKSIAIKCNQCLCFIKVHAKPLWPLLCSSSSLVLCCEFGKHSYDFSYLFTPIKLMASLNLSYMSNSQQLYPPVLMSHWSKATKEQNKWWHCNTDMYTSMKNKDITLWFAWTSLTSWDWKWLHIYDLWRKRETTRRTSKAPKLTGIEKHSPSHSAIAASSFFSSLLQRTSLWKIRYLLSKGGMYLHSVIPYLMQWSGLLRLWYTAGRTQKTSAASSTSFLHRDQSISLVYSEKEVSFLMGYQALPYIFTCSWEEELMEGIKIKMLAKVPNSPDASRPTKKGSFQGVWFLVCVRPYQLSELQD